MGRKRKIRNFNQNDGVPGVVYIIKNPHLKKNLLKIGCSRRSGAVRAEELKKEASTGIPAVFNCVFECKTKDCGRAEKAVHSALESFRRGKPGQEWFKIDIETAKSCIEEECERQNQRVEEESLSGLPTRNPNEFRQGASAAAQDAKDEEIKRLKAQLESKDKTLESLEKKVDKIASWLSPPKPPKKKRGCGCFVCLIILILLVWLLWGTISVERRSGSNVQPKDAPALAATQPSSLPHFSGV